MHETVCVVGGGWSAAQLDLQHLPGIVIGVNESGVLIPCKYAVSMDRLWTESRWPKLAERAGQAYIRDAALKNVRERPDWLHVFNCDYKRAIFSDDPATLNGTNSGFCALNLAYILSPLRIFLIGFDMNRSPEGRAYWHAPYPWTDPQGATKPGKYTEWAGQFADAARAFRARNIEVFNVSATSAITAFAKIAPKQFERMK